MEDLLTIALPGLASLSLLITLFTHAALHRKLSRHADRPQKQLPPISILKPLKGVDDGLLENLRSFARQEYPDYELLLGTEDPDDPALEIAQQVKQEFPHVRITIVTGAPAIGRNPKVSNVAHMARFARNELLLISDSNVRVSPGYLEDSAALIDGAGMVCHLIVGTGEQTVGAAFENLHLSSFYASAVATGDLLRHPCVVGKSMLFRRADLQRVGGWNSVKDVLAEDYVLGRAFERHGMHVALSSQPIETVNVTWSMRRFLSRHVRWAQMRRRINPFAYGVEPLLHPTPWLLMSIASPATRDAALAGLGLKIASELFVLGRLLHRVPDLENAALVPLKDLAAAAIWVIGFFKRTVEWRGRTLYLGSGALLVDENSPEFLATDTRS